MTDDAKQKKIPTKEQKAAADPTRSVWVAASAGSGKTQVLVDRVVRLLLDGAEPQAILCLTFTKAAAAEMANRLFERLSGWIALSDTDLDEELKNLGVPDISTKLRASARRLFARALETPGGLKIQTIHAFCERLLQQFPVESGMAPGFRVLEDQESKQLFRDALLESLSSDDKRTQAAWEFLDDGSVSTLDQLETLAKPFLSGSGGMRQRLSDWDNLGEVKQALREFLEASTETTETELVSLICDVDTLNYRKAIDALMPHESDADFCAPKYLEDVLAETQDAERLRKLAALVLTKTGPPRKKLLRKKASDSEPQLAAWLDEERSRILDGLMELAKQQAFDANVAIYTAMAGVLAKVNIEKRTRGLYDFDDLIARTAQLLNSHEAAQWVLYKLDKGLTHILVDEAQDTSPAQWTIIKALAGEFFTTLHDEQGRKRTVFAVGDIKQSIYSFQGADIAAFETARLWFSDGLAGLQDKLDVVDLSISYRSTQQVLNVVDRVFAPGQAARSGFGARAADEREHTAFAKERIGLVELWDIMRPDELEEQSSWRAPVDALSRSHPRLKLAERIARTVKSWIGRREISGRKKTVGPGDILILLQSRNVLFNALIGALRRHGVPVAGADRLKLQESLIVQDMMMLGQFIRLPQDDHALACVLKSPLVPEPLSEEQLFELAHGRGGQSLWERLDDASRNHEMLAEALVSKVTPYMFFASVLQQSMRRILSRLGQEADDAGQEFLTLALDYEQRYGTSLTGFLDWLSQGETTIKREMEAGSGLVRLMTVHGSKGLEAPIVFLADAADPLPTERGRLVQVTDEGPWRGLQLFKPKTLMTPPALDVLKNSVKDLAKAERMRLLYVGMTRAADELYICGSLNAKELSDDSWYPHVSAALRDANGLQEVRLVSDDPTLTIWRFGAEPVWRDAVPISDTSIDDLPVWAIQPVARHPAKPAPLLSSRNSDSFNKQAVEQGIATHRLIELMAEVEPNERAMLGLRWAKRLKLPEDLVGRLDGLLRLPELAALFGIEGQSEVSIDGTVPGLGRVTGRLDRLAIGGGTIHLLDYKTNRNPPVGIGSDHQYARQMAGYAALLQQAYPDHSIKAALLWTQTGAVTWLTPQLLSHALDQRMKETA